VSIGVRTILQKVTKCQGEDDRASSRLIFSLDPHR
jgi:hypothetical protein